MGMTTNLVSGVEPFVQIVNNLSTESSMWNLVKIANLEMKTFKNNTILYMYITQGQGQIILRGQNSDWN